LITCFLTLSPEKEIIVLGTSLEKVLDFGPKNLDEPCINPFGPKSDQRQFSPNNISRSSSEGYENYEIDN